MEEHTLISLAGIVIIGTAAQWLAMRLKLPSILFLLLFGFLTGPVFHLINPDELFGHLLFPVISLSVAIILFEGAMDLRLSELKDIGQIVGNFISIGVLATWVMVGLACYYILHLNLSLSILFGAILVVTGPTVIGPLLRHVRPSGRVKNIVKWEGIMNDPVGVLLAVLVFECVLVGNLYEAWTLVIFGILKTIFLSAAVGVGSAYLLTFLLSRYWIPDVLHQVVTLMFIFITLIVANLLQVESGLLAVTLMGIIMANQDKVAVKHIVEFKEILRVLMISILFIILTARLQLSDFQDLNIAHGIFLVVLIVIIRPVSVLLSSVGTNLKWKEIVFISLMAPRGIVAAAMASIFSFQLVKEGHPQGASLIPLTFMVITVTVTFYSLVITPVSRWLGIAKADPQGVMIVGAHSWGRLIGQKLVALGFKVLMVDSNRGNIRQSFKEGLESYQGNVLQENVEDRLNLDEIGKIMCMTSNDEANALAAMHFQDLLGSAHVFQLSPEPAEGKHIEKHSPKHMRGRHLFRKGLDYDRMSKVFAAGVEFKEVMVTEKFDLEQFFGPYDGQAIPLFLVNGGRTLKIFAGDDPLEPVAGQRIVYVAKKS
ncbi:MAG: cation:proton antiporter [Candidatus Omnitrophica bacterium]|nr:cation:proton antiporter [Candidatus Omnitrophota bacterium]